MMRAGSLFAGIGGLDMGLEKSGLCKTVWVCETDKSCAEVLDRQFSNTPNYGDVTTIDWTAVPPVDVLHGGFPCQDISEAGLGAGITQGRRSGLWANFADAIRVLRPRIIVVENVSALLGRGLDVVLADLASLGLDARWASVRASDVGAAHSRERIFIVAIASHADRTGSQRTRSQTPGKPRPSVGDPSAFPWGKHEPAIRRWGDVVGRPAPSPVDGQGRLTVDFAEWFMGFPDAWTSGLSKTRAIQALGNAVVPQVAELVGRWALSMVDRTAPWCLYCAPDENCPDHEALPTAVPKVVA